MNLLITREKIIDFLYDNLPEEEMSYVADMIVKDPLVNKMFKEEKDNITLHLYVDKELHSCTRAEFEYNMSMDKKLAEDVYLQQKIGEYINLYNFHETLKKICSGESTEKPTTLLPASKVKHWFLAASVFVFLATSVVFLYQNKNTDVDRLFAKYYEPFNKNGKYALNSNILDTAQEKYKNGEYKQALSLFQELPASLPLNAERNFYIGLSLMELKQYEVAIDNFKKVIKSKEAVGYLPQVEWYQALCFLKTGQTEKARTIFNRIVSYNDYNSSKAKKILRRL